jgi:hypothetical protein
MYLVDKIKSIYPALQDKDFDPISGSIHLMNTGQDDYIAKWEHPTLAKPTDEQLAAVGE